MKTVGEILKQARTEQGMSMAALAAKTKIQVKYLVALEENRWEQLPAATFVKGFVRNYAQQVGKDPESLVAIFRRDYGENQQGQIVPRTRDYLVSSRWRWTPKLTAIAATALAVTLFGGYLGWQLNSLSRPPKLKVEIPGEGQAFEQTTIEVKGQSEADAQVLVNNKPVMVTEKGEFAETLLLPTGKHTVTVKAVAKNGKTKVIQRTITISEQNLD